MKKYLFIVFAFQFVTFFFRAGAQPAQIQPAVKITGEVTNMLTLTMHDLEAYQQTVVTRKGKDNKDHRYSGVLLSSILEKAGVTLDKQLRGKNLRKYVLITADDGYQVVFALAELDKDFTDNAVILATSADGKPLDNTEGPFHIIVQADKYLQGV